MSKHKVIRGITWNHTRGILPLQAAAQIFHEENPNYEIVWEKRSLQAFADAPLESMVDRYDMLVIDHPHVGDAAKSGNLLPANDFLDVKYLTDQEKNSVGRSYESYIFDGKLLALPIDAATPVSVYRPDLLSKNNLRLPETWTDMLELAKAGLVVMPCIPVNSLMDFYMLVGACGGKLFEDGKFCGREEGITALHALREITGLVPDWCKEADPIRIHRYLSTSSKELYCPSAYGYSAYSMKGYAPNLLKGGSLVTFNGKQMKSTIGGTGLAVSAVGKNQEIVFAYARLLASPEFQKTIYVSSGGQPGHRGAWEDEYTNSLTGDYFRDTLPTLDDAYLRPRYDGYIYFQDHAGDEIFNYRVNGGNEDQVLKKLEEIYLKSLSREAGK